MFGTLATLGMSIGGSIMAGSAADKASDAAMAAGATQAKGYEKAGRVRQAGMKKAVGYLRPWEESGRQGQELLNDALGINGPDAQRAFFANFQNDPGFEALQGAGINTVEQSRAVGGNLRSGATMKALHDFGMRLQHGVFQDRMTRLGDVGKMGATAATNMGTLTDGAYRDMAGYKIGEGNAMAGGMINASNAQQMGTQNQLSLLGYGMGQAKQPLNDLFSSFKMPGGLSGPSLGGGIWAGL